MQYRSKFVILNVRTNSTNIAIDLLNTNISAFGHGLKKCPGENWSKILIEKITKEVSKHFYEFKNIKYSRVRFSWGPVYMENKESQT